MTTVQRIKEIEDEMARTQKNKATAYHLGQLRAKLAKLKRELIAPSSSGGGGGGMGFDVARTGIASVGFVGFPSVGKSTLMSGLTGTTSEAAAYEFTTLTTVPGTMVVRGARIQILDLPGIIEGAKDGKGRGRQVIAVARTCNLIFIVLDVCKPLHDKQILEAELEGFGIRLNKKPPNVIVKKKDKGGLAITNTVPLTKLDHDEIRAVMSEYRISNADIAFREDVTVEELIDVIEGNRIYIPCIYVRTKSTRFRLKNSTCCIRFPNRCLFHPGCGSTWTSLLIRCGTSLILSACTRSPVSAHRITLHLSSCAAASVPSKTFAMLFTVRFSSSSSALLFGARLPSTRAANALVAIMCWKTRTASRSLSVNPRSLVPLYFCLYTKKLPCRSTGTLYTFPAGNGMSNVWLCICERLSHGA